MPETHTDLTFGHKMRPKRAQAHTKYLFGHKNTPKRARNAHKVSLRAQNIPKTCPDNEQYNTIIVIYTNNANNSFSFRLVHQSHYPNLSTGSGIDVLNR